MAEIVQTSATGSEAATGNGEEDSLFQAETESIAWIVDIENKIRSEAHKAELQPQPKIGRVPSIIREKNLEFIKYCFDPMVVSIGPFHHGESVLQQMETYKIQFACQFADQSKKSMEKLYLEVEKRAIDARNCYAEGSIDAKFNDDKKFARMMFIDGCFLLQFIYNCFYSTKDDVKMQLGNIKFIVGDIRLLENQLPFKFLKTLMSLRFKEGEGERIMDDFIRLTTGNLPEEENASCWKTCWNCKPDPKPKSDSKVKKEPFHLLELIMSKFVDVDEIRDGSCHSMNLWPSYSVSELKRMGIHFKPNHSRRFSDIKFQSGWLFGCLRIPSIIINESNVSTLLNMVAWEACLVSPDDLVVSSLIFFMDSLINNAEDVKELRSNGLIKSGMGTDEEIAKLFNNLGRYLLFDHGAYGKVKSSIDAHSKSHTRIKAVEWIHNHFSSPWVVAFLVTTLLIGLTIAQTVFAAK